MFLFKSCTGWNPVHSADSDSKCAFLLLLFCGRGSTRRSHGCCVAADSDEVDSDTPNMYRAGCYQDNMSVISRAWLRKYKTWSQATQGEQQPALGCLLRITTDRNTQPTQDCESTCQLCAQTVSAQYTEIKLSNIKLMLWSLGTSLLQVYNIFICHFDLNHINTITATHRCKKKKSWMTHKIQDIKINFIKVNQV